MQIYSSVTDKSVNNLSVAKLHICLWLDLPQSQMSLNIVNFSQPELNRMEITTHIQTPCLRSLMCHGTLPVHLMLQLFIRFHIILPPLPHHNTQTTILLTYTSQNTLPVLFKVYCFIYYNTSAFLTT